MLGGFSAFSQSTASLRGVVADPSSAVIPQAVVVLNNIDNGSRRNTLTDSTGGYSFLQVAPGKYTLVIDKPGFATMTRDNIQLLVNTPATLDVTLTISASGEGECSRPGDSGKHYGRVRGQCVFRTTGTAVAARDT